MNDVEPFYIPSHLDDPERWLFWTMDEAAALIGPVIVGFVFGMPFTGFVMGAAAYWALKRLKGSEQVNIAIYAVYWFYPSFVSRLAATPPSAVRCYVG